MAIHNEVEFEKEICEYLAEHGWLYSVNDTGYDRARALYRRCGFAEVGLRRGYYPLPEGAREDAIVMSLLLPRGPHALD